MSKKEIEEEKEETTEEEEEEKEEEEEEEEENIDEEVDKAAEKITKTVYKSLNIKELTAKIDKLVNRDNSVAAKIWVSKDVQKDVGSLTKEEIIVGFYTALIHNDVVALKALSEGTPADGGYLFPDEFRQELIKNLEAETRMRSLVRVIPMRKDIMNAPKLGSRPHITWTSENAAKSTTTADFGQKTLTVFKMAAIMYASDELVEDCSEFDVVQLVIDLFADAIAAEEDRVIIQGDGTTQPTGFDNCTIASVTCSGNLSLKKLLLIEKLIAKAVNCWETLTSKARAISSQALSAMTLKVQRLGAESLWDSNAPTSAAYLVS